MKSSDVNLVTYDLYHHMTQYAWFGIISGLYLLVHIFNHVALPLSYRHSPLNMCTEFIQNAENMHTHTHRHTHAHTQTYTSTYM